MHPNFYFSPVNVFVLWLSGYVMNVDQFKDPFCYLCLCGTMVLSLPLMQGLWVQDSLFFEFSESQLGKTPIKVTFFKIPLESVAEPLATWV